MKFICEKYPYYKVAFEGGYIEFKNNKYKTDSKKEIEVLKNITDIKCIEDKKIEKKVTK